MAIVQESFIRCTECDNAEFRESKRFTFHKTVKPRDDKTKSLPSMEEIIVYECSKCRHVLDR